MNMAGRKLGEIDEEREATAPSDRKSADDQTRATVHPDVGKNKQIASAANLTGSSGD